MFVYYVLIAILKLILIKVKMLGKERGLREMKGISKVNLIKIEEYKDAN